MADVTLTTTNQIPPKNIPDSLDGLVLTVANGDIGDADTSYFYFDLVKAGFNVFSLQFTIQATTLTVEGSNSLPSVSNASAVWTDITDVVTNGTATSFIASGSVTRSSPLPWSRLRVKRVTTSATNALTLNLTRGRSN